MVYCLSTIAPRRDLDAIALGNGVLYVAGVAFLDSASPGKVVFTRSLDGGVSFEDLRDVPGSELPDTDRPSVFADPSTDPERKDRLYVLWTEPVTNRPSPLLLRSCDGGAAFDCDPPVGTDPPVALHTPASGRLAQVPLAAVGPNGELYVAWLDFDLNKGGLDDKIMLRRSGDGGATFDPPLSASPRETTPFMRIDSSNPFKGLPNADFRHRSVPSIAVDPTDGTGRTVYVAYEAFTALEAPNEIDADIFVVASTDAGATWSMPVVVNDDSPGPERGADQFFPWMAIDEHGTLGVMWYDRRNDPANERIDVFFAYSTDGGQNWSANVQVTDVMSKPATFSESSFPFLGDYNGLSARDGTFFPLWTDLRQFTGSGNIYTARANQLRLWFSSVAYVLLTAPARQPTTSGTQVENRRRRGTRRAPFSGPKSRVGWVL